ncbi:hypothetical protein SLA2020_262670 [Shorea laevis]
MASVRRVLLSISATKGLISMPRFLLIRDIITIQRSLCEKAFNPNPLLARLLQEPSSRIKSALDSEDMSALKSSGFSWEALVTSLRSSSPQKAQLVLEWRLEKMLEEK